MLCFASMVTIRRMTHDDLATLSSFWQEQSSLIAQSDPRVLSASAVEDWRRGMTLLIHDERAVAFVAVDDRGFAGYIVGWEPPVGLLPSVGVRLAVIGDLVIDMHHYRGGIARRLVGALREEFDHRGVTKLVAFSLRSHVTGQAFWRAMRGVEWMDGFWLNE